MPTPSTRGRNGSCSRGTNAPATRGAAARNKDHLKSDRAATMADNPPAQRDSFGSRHNEDKITKRQRKVAGPHHAGRDTGFRESAQDTQRNRGAANKKGTGRRHRKSGSPRE